VTDIAPNEATVRVRNLPLLGAVLGRVVGMLAARAQCPIDRLDDALLLTDAVAAHAPGHVADGSVTVVVRTGQDGLEMCVGPLKGGGAREMLEEASLPGVGNVFERVADAVEPGTAPDGAGDQLTIRLAFAPTT
jgi:hypothetical protein